MPQDIPSITIHQDLAAGRWQKMTLCEQLGNIGSEVSRALNWQERGNEEQSWRAFDRALELFSLTQTDKRWFGRLQEVARAKEVFGDFFIGSNEYQSSKESIIKYFDAFAIVARR
ncbi:MAG: hypothetical protein A2821_01375 [Candidatus Magasanikbacteria bacterium RIFCSPHIGHO2_01_FULL_41_23]|uniref:Uncharacterized protein n=1 Tax=Candidatus Magasanikbacteria bacterium RIFCSPLOWO2_01_FULL_40_15 TaxID=1798686 RepID=A0A1F6N5C8_9BACT|nr:MAG: hypothetical protein A2821_01375 [Candidatus Magasanikbacteria bacterium RIFCSPHIGHO2_01_FULL_41_23]OGH66776.1 MAG: hypothetical protein A3C66_01680 [Candidatus Magasanikbacteria bacterium RIFCSPHIGHO2_02_FULL_41_35]OGH74574.1 MAG: hypothetical protein A3F22_03085 [Candidatus Magasanikbacteria bacterium RIFCSPHIGHO2_12_FULL_41_16]OGH78863.1 MAG: hypothetical protein A2983_00835 [Candidatus Magasanikbacteria bacterium RIFCSPLOWO2_01_FULL_40_15]